MTQAPGPFTTPLFRALTFRTGGRLRVGAVGVFSVLSVLPFLLGVGRLEMGAEMLLALLRWLWENRKSIRCSRSLSRNSVRFLYSRSKLLCRNSSLNLSTFPF